MKVKAIAYMVQKGQHKGDLVVRTGYDMPVKTYVRSLTPYSSIMDMVHFSRDGKVRSTVRLAYPEYRVHRDYLVPVGEVMVPGYLVDTNGLEEVSGFHLLERYAGKTRSEVEQLARTDRRLHGLRDYAADIRS